MGKPAFFGFWVHNYGIWSVLTDLESAGVPSGDLQIRGAVAWLKDGQNDDGGWGESNDSYEEHYARGTRHPSGCAQTAWALLALMAAGERDTPEVRRGIDFLLRDQRGDGLWHDPGSMPRALPASSTSSTTGLQVLPPNLGINTDTAEMLSPELSFRRNNKVYKEIATDLAEALGYAHRSSAGPERPSGRGQRRG